VQLDGQQPSPALHVCIATSSHRTSQVSMLPTSIGIKHLSVARQESTVGQVPGGSQVSPISTIPLPQTASPDIMPLPASPPFRPAEAAPPLAAAPPFRPEPPALLGRPPFPLPPVESPLPPDPLELVDEGPPSLSRALRHSLSSGSHGRCAVCCFASSIGEQPTTTTANTKGEKRIFLGPRAH
jgi:hypothetical protein